MYPTNIFLRSSDDPDAAGPAIVDLYDLRPEACFIMTFERTAPHNLVLSATAAGKRPRYAFAYHLLSRALWNKRHLHCITIPCPNKAFPWWQLNFEHLIAVKERLFREIAYETAIICMDVFIETVEQAYRNGEIDQDNLAKFLAICRDIPANSRSDSEELAKIVQTSLAECKLHHSKSLLARRDSVALIMAYVVSMSQIESFRISTKHIQRQELLEGLKQHTLHIPSGKNKYYKRIAPLGYTATAFLDTWLNSVYGSALFCERSQFPDCQSGHLRLYTSILTRRLSIVMKQPPPLEAFHANYKTLVHAAYESGRISSTTRKLLLGHIRLPFEETLDTKEISRLRSFYIELEDTLGWWDIPFKR